MIFHYISSKFRPVIVYVTSNIRLFADDCLVYREVTTKADCEELQKDLDRLTSWSNEWGMSFNVAKCNAMTVTNKTTTKVNHDYSMSGKQLVRVKNTLYLGVTLNSKLKWDDHV